MFWDLSREEQLHGDASIGMLEDNRTLTPTEKTGENIHKLLNEALPKIKKHPFRFTSQIKNRSVCSVIKVTKKK